MASFAFRRTCFSRRSARCSKALGKHPQGTAPRVARCGLQRRGDRSDCGLRGGRPRGSGAGGCSSGPLRRRASGFAVRGAATATRREPLGSGHLRRSARERSARWPCPAPRFLRPGARNSPPACPKSLPLSVEKVQGRSLLGAHCMLAARWRAEAVEAIDQAQVNFSSTSGLAVGVMVGFLVFAVALDLTWNQFRRSGPRQRGHVG